MRYSRMNPSPSLPRTGCSIAGIYWRQLELPIGNPAVMASSGRNPGHFEVTVSKGFPDCSTVPFCYLSNHSSRLPKASCSSNWSIGSWMPSSLLRCDVRPLQGYQVKWDYPGVNPWLCFPSHLGPRSGNIPNFILKLDYLKSQVLR